MEHYIYLDQQDKAKLMKQAFNKQLSLSTYVYIITKNYYALCLQDYIHKGEKTIHVKIRNHKSFEFTDKILTNACYLFLHGNETKFKECNLQKLNRCIQSESDKTIDYNFMKNQIIRTTYKRK